MKNKFYIEANIKLEDSIDGLKEKASKVIKLPEDIEKQPDLSYFSGILVSSGENLNHGYFLGSELVSAEKSVVNKALDIEHIEDEIVGHIYDCAYVDDDGNRLDSKELASMETASLDGKSMHIAIAGIIYKSRFPNISDEIASNQWKLSMECYYDHYDVKIGDVIINKDDATVMGLTSLEASIGKAASIVRAGKEIAKGTVARVFRQILFSGAGIVKNPANPKSIIMETASIYNKDDVIVLNLDNKDFINNVTSDKIEDTNFKEVSKDGRLDDSLGICINYKKLYKDNEVEKANWCTMYNQNCTSFSKDLSDPDCLFNVNIKEVATKILDEKLDNTKNVKTLKLLNALKAALSEAVKTQSQ